MICVFNSSIPRLFGARAITLWPLIFFEETTLDAIDNHTLLHELTHAAQLKEHGVIGFYWKYVMEYLKNRINGDNHWDAYYNLKFEIEARALEPFRLPKRYSEIFHTNKKFVRVTVDKTLEGYRDLS
jgi:hypothetical protein